MMNEASTLPRLTAHGNVLYDTAGQRVAMIELMSTSDRRVEMQLALAAAFAALTQNRCPGCGQEVEWRSLGYQHLDKAAPGVGPGWVPCSGTETFTEPGPYRTCLIHAARMPGCHWCSREDTSET